MKKVLKHIGNGLLVLVLIVVLVITGSLLISSFTPAGASVFGYHPMRVMSDSMEDTIMVGDWILVQERDTANLQVGEVISFLGQIDGKGEPEIFTHRIAEVIPQPDGTVVYHTKGDNYELIDQHEFNIFRQDPVTPDKIVGVWTEFRVSGTDFQNIILYFMIIPVGVIFIWQLVVVIRIALKMHREKQVEMVKAEKDRVIEEYLAAQKAKEEAEAAAAEATPSVNMTESDEDSAPSEE